MTYGGWRDWHTVLPQAPLTEQMRAGLHLPSTLRPLVGEGLTQRAVFDPALNQHGNAYRAADPLFDDPQTGTAWRAAQRMALDRVLAGIADSPWAASLVLRGSALMVGWFGEAAREPGDLDFVVVPDDWGIDDARTAAMFDGIALAAQHAAEGHGGVCMSAADAISEDIWTYDRVPGRRLVLPWSAPGLPGGQVQIDVVFNEKLPMAPVATRVPAFAGDGPGALVQAVTPELSLAWKILWLSTDRHPQGKDLYDAILLAERHLVSFELLEEVFRCAGTWTSECLEGLLLHELQEALEYVDWRHFAAEYPQITDAHEQYTRRMMEALAFVRRECSEEESAEESAEGQGS